MRISPFQGWNDNSRARAPRKTCVYCIGDFLSTFSLPLSVSRFFVPVTSANRVLRGELRKTLSKIASSIKGFSFSFLPLYAYISLFCMREAISLLNVGLFTKVEFLWILMRNSKYAEGEAKSRFPRKWTKTWKFSIIQRNSKSTGDLVIYSTFLGKRYSCCSEWCKL